MVNGEKSCFVIAPIGSEESETRKRSDLVLKHIIKPAAEECGYNAVRADEISEPGVITTQVIQRLIDDDLVIADLTERNPNVFYELAIRHAIRKPVVQIIKRDEKIPFDVTGQRTIHYDLDLDSAAACKEELINQIRAAEKDPEKVDSPVSTAIDLKVLRESAWPEKASEEDFSKIAEEKADEKIENIRKEMSEEMEARISEISKKSRKTDAQIRELQDSMQQILNRAIEESRTVEKEAMAETIANRILASILKATRELGYEELNADTIFDYVYKSYGQEIETRTFLKELLRLRDDGLIDLPKNVKAWYRFSIDTPVKLTKVGKEVAKSSSS